MPIIVEIEKLETLKRELQEADPEDVRKWWQYKCEQCGHHVASDIRNKNGLFCIKCGGNMPEVLAGESSLPGNASEQEGPTK
ncbi:MAG: hypothetical protein ACHQ0Y_05010 [Thermodesulfovibrionales bacterium]